jgi:hypothetical protein
VGKIILILILLFGASLYFPRTRPVVLDTLAPVLNPGLEWQSRNEMREILRALRVRNQAGRELPARGRSFLVWMEAQYPGGRGMDAWGTPYSLKTWADSIGIASNGPDLEINTADDFVETTRIERQRRRR